MAEREPVRLHNILFEFTSVGNVVKVSAIDPRSGTEVAIVGNPRAGTETLKRLAKLPVEIRTGTAITRFADGWAHLRTGDHAEKIGPFDSVVVAVGTRPERELLAPLSAGGIETYVVGDALAPRQILGAVQSAWQVARTI